MTDTITQNIPPLSDENAFNARHAVFGIQSESLKARQTAAWNTFRELPYPTRTSETWRFASIKAIKEIERFAPSAFETVERPDLVERSKRISSVSGRFIFADENLIAAREIDPELEAKGVIFTTLIDALNNHQELVEKYLLQQSPELGSEKFESLHIAMLRTGVFLYVPKGVEIKAPFVVYNWAVQKDTAIFPHTLFVCDENASAELVEFQECAQPETEHLVIANAHVYAESGSRPCHTILQNWNRKTLSFQLNTSNAQRDVNSRGVLINVGSAHTRQEIHGKIFGSRADVNIFSLNIARGDQEMDQRTLQTHIAPNSRSDLLFKNALLDQSKTIFSGLIIVEPDAQQTDAYQTNNNLMLSDQAEANSLPGLEIKANDVKCSHGATSGKIDDSNIFYFLSRGIPRKKAEELMVFGFLEEIIEKIENEELSDYVRSLVQQQLIDQL